MPGIEYFSVLSLWKRDRIVVGCRSGLFGGEPKDGRWTVGTTLSASYSLSSCSSYHYRHLPVHGVRASCSQIRP